MFGTLKQVIVQCYVLSSEGIKKYCYCFTLWKDPVPTLQEAGWAPGLVWTGGKSRPHRNFFINYNFIDPSVHKYNGCMEDISVMYC